MIVEFVIFSVTAIVVYYVYRYKKAKYHFESRDVKFLPFWPFFGNTFFSLLQKRHVFEDLDNTYKAVPNERYVGHMDATRPVIMIRDPEIIRNTTVKEFDHFVDHMNFFDENFDPFFGSSLLAMKDLLLGYKEDLPSDLPSHPNLLVVTLLNNELGSGEKWRDMRATLSPAFTGAKMRHMLQFVNEVSDNIIQYLQEHVSEELDIDDLMRRYTSDVIASASFGLKVNSIQDKKNEFFLMGQSCLSFTFYQVVKIIFADQLPRVAKLLGVKAHSEKTYKFFNNIIENTIKERKKNNVHRPDMIQLLMETPKEWTLQEITSQAFVFFAAGFETSASMLVLGLHELALNQDVQDRLYQEIKAFKDTKGEMNHDNMAELKYLDCVVNETLRKWSPAIILDRQCVKTYELPPPREGGKPYVLQPGDVIFNSVNSLHRDPQHFPDPLTFDPDRFSEDNKHKIKPFTFMPFGSGPRICIGIRFALMEIKVLLYHIVLNYSIQRSAKTSDPIQLLNSGFFMKSRDGSFVKFEKRADTA